MWNGGSKQLLSFKTPTCILFKKNLEIVSFGYQAEDDYAAVVTDDTEDDYYFFQQFKMKLNRREVSFNGFIVFFLFFVFRLVIYLFCNIRSNS